MGRLTLEQRRDVRYSMQLIASHAAKNTPAAVVDTHIENLVDRIDYLEPPRWQRALARRASRHADGSDR